MSRYLHLFNFSRPLHGLPILHGLLPAVNCWAIVRRPLTRTGNYFLSKDDARASSVFALIALLLCTGAAVEGQSQEAVRAPTPASVRRTPGTTQQQRRLIRHNEAGALTSLQTLFSAEATYQATTGNGDYGTLDELGKEKLIDYLLAEGHRFGYFFYVRREKRSSESQPSLELVAVPRSYGKTGHRSFYMDESGVIHAADKKGAEARPGDQLLAIDP